jgi:hypothetical protein
VCGLCKAMAPGNAWQRGARQGRADRRLLVVASLQCNARNARNAVQCRAARVPAIMQRCNAVPELAPAGRRLRHGERATHGLDAPRLSGGCRHGLALLCVCVSQRNARHLTVMPGRLTPRAPLPGTLPPVLPPVEPCRHDYGYA